MRTSERQLAFPEFDHPPADDLLFFAFQPPLDIAPQIVRIDRSFRNDHGLRGGLIEPQRLHVSLHGFGPYPGLPETVVDTATAVGAAIKTPPFDIVFDRAMSFWSKRPKRPFVLRAGGDVVALSAFYRMLGAALTRAGLDHCAGSHFTPHMTLLYDRVMVAEHEIETVRWTVRELVLVHSLQGQSRYIELGRWPLQG